MNGVFSFIICCLLTLFFSCPTWAAPKEVTIFPQAARVTEETKVRLITVEKDLRKAVIVIPGTADPGSFVISLPSEANLRLEDHVWSKIPRDEDSAIKDRRRKIKQSREERNGLQGSLQGLENQIQFWQQQTKARAKTTSEAVIIAAAISKNIKKAVQEKLNLGPEIPRLDRSIKELEEELNLMRGKNDQPWMWEVTIFLSGVTAGATVQDVLLAYSYTLTGCGWQPTYRLDARPQRGEILFGQEAEAWQNSGQHWNDVVVHLATFTAPTSFLAPTALPLGTLKTREVIMSKGKRPAEKAKALSIPADGPAEALAEVNEAPSPADIKLWPVGRKTIPAGSRVRIMLHEEAWPTSFGYLARPGEGPQAFISALFTLPEGRKILPGQAILSHQGTLLGKSSFSLAGKQGLLYFGQDPRVTVTRQLLPDQPKFRQWRLEARNDHTTPIRLRIEESTPQTPDAKTKVMLLVAGAEEKPGLLSWTVELAAGERKALTYGIELEVSADRKIESGSPP